MSDNTTPETIIPAKPKSRVHLYLLGFLGILGIIASGYVFALALKSHGLSPFDIWPFGARPASTADHAKLGTFGDFIGGSLNPVLSFLTFLGVLITIAIQIKELQATRDEMELTRRATQDSAQALTAQRNSLERQNFESTFFQMMKLLTDIIDGMSLHGSAGRSAITQIVLIADSRYNTASRQRVTPETILFNTIDEYKNLLQHYFRMIFNIIKYIDDEVIPKDSSINKIRYIKILRSQISGTELILLYFNCLTNDGKKMKEYAEKYSLFDNLQAGINLILNSTSICNFNIRAFGDNAELLRRYNNECKKG